MCRFDRSCCFTWSYDFHTYDILVHGCISVYISSSSSSIHGNVFYNDIFVFLWRGIFGKDFILKLGYELGYNTGGKVHPLITPFKTYDTPEEVDAAIKQSIQFYKSTAFFDAKDTDFVLIRKNFS